jgi:hypothetical protein
VARYLAAGLAGLDLQELRAERLRRYWSSEPPRSSSAGVGELLALGKQMERRDRRYRRNHEPPQGEPERRVLRAQGPDDQLSAALARRCVLGEGLGSLLCSSELCGDREPPCLRSWQSRALRAARYERATPLWRGPCRSWHERHCARPA